VPRLIVIKGPDEGKQFDLDGEPATVGRDAGNRIRLHDVEVSRRHAEFTPTPEGYRLHDRGSVNGTYVNNQSVRDVLLKPGDHVQMGQSTLVFSAGRAEAAPPGDLAEHISLITRQEPELSSVIVQTIDDAEGSRLLSRPEEADGPWLKAALANLGIMYEAIQAVSHILDLNELLERIMDLIFRSLEADRGCIMLRTAADSADRGPDPPDSAGLEPKAVRWRDGVRRQEKIPVSRTLMDYVLREKRGMLVSDAARDERFQAVQSIVRSGVREILCVPMKGRHETLGVLYLDRRTPARPGGPLSLGGPAEKFTADHLALAIAIAHQAALAVEETRYRQALVQAERLAAVGQTIAALSHHIKNILQGLHTGGNIVRAGLQEGDVGYAEQGWRIVEKNQAKIADLVMDMLSYSKEREPSLEDTDLNAVVREVAEVVSGRAAEAGVRLEVHPDASLPRCLADAEGVHRALLNVVSNALDAVEGADGPRVTVTTARDPDGEWARVEVQDNGPGIPPGSLAEIFRPFVSTKGSRGTGLGLAVSRKILREHGGDILVQSRPGAGSTFTLRLPFRRPNGPAGTGCHPAVRTPPPPTE
jgi:signal transduction histidine kinase/pSer/pThr/pTyr-binding forkhead associated (FHA) protein